MDHPPAIVWNEALQTGVEEIDSQHRILVASVNAANAALHDSRPGPLFDLITKDLLAYAIYHFDTEEGLMKQYGYGEADADLHRQAHREFSEAVVSARQGLHDSHRDACRELLAYLNDWLVRHIQGTDRRLAEFILRARQPSG